MAKVKVNFTDVQDFEPIPAGIYPVVITDVELKESKSSEFPYIACQLTILEGEYEDRKLFLNLSTNPRAAFMVKRNLEALGYKDLDGDLDLDTDELMGLQSGAVVTITEYNGRQTNSVDQLVVMDEVDTPKPQKGPAKSGNSPRPRPGAAKGK